MPNPKRAHLGVADTTGADTPAALTIDAAADYVSMSRKTIYDELRAGRLAAVRLGPRRGAVRITRAELDRYLADAQAWEPAS